MFKCVFGFLNPLPEACPPLTAALPLPRPGDGAEEPGQSRRGGQRLLRNVGPVLPAAADPRRGYQRPRDGQAELGGHLEVRGAAGHVDARRRCISLTLLVFCSPFDKDDQTTSTSTVSKRLLSNQSPPDTPSMREQVFYVSHVFRPELRHPLSKHHYKQLLSCTCSLSY